MDRWRRIEALFDATVNQPPSQRDAYLRRACAEDLELYREVISLLSHHADGADDESWAARAAVALLEDQSRVPHRSASSSLAPGMSLGPYRITGVLGAGAMGEVYRARDSHLNRDVALKVLPESLALDPDRLARLRREAQIVASLNHRNIAAIYRFEDCDSIEALVLEFVEGPTLAERIAHGRISLDQALLIAKQITEALEAAHDRGIIHRDLKPANIKVQPDGTVKLLDFGLAKMLDPGPTTSADASARWTPDEDLTDGCAILGTWAYMSPEQARGMRVDARTDVWAFGCVLYEILTGHRAFEGSTSSEVLARVLEREPDFDALPAGTPENIVRLLRRALTKDMGNRLHAIADARLDVVETLASLSKTAAARTDRASRVVSPVTPGAAARAASFVAWRRLALALGALALAIVPAIVWVSARQQQEARPVSRYELRLPEAAPLLTGGTTVHLAISPDGSRRVYPTNRGIAVQSRDNLDVTVIDSRYSMNPFFSPDGQWIGFIGDGLRKVAVSGGPTTLLAPAGAGATATWGDDGIILADANGLFRVPHSDGIPEPLPGATLQDMEQAAFPEMLPGGSAVLFTVIPTRTNTPEIIATSAASRIEALDARTGSRKVIVRGGGRPRYLPTGHLVYGSGETIVAVEFDPDRLETRGDPVQIADRGGASFAVSNEGTLIYVAGNVFVAGKTSPLRRLVWVDRRGREEDLGAPAAVYNHPRLSPDGSRVATDIYFENRDIYVWNITRKLLERFTVDPAEDLLAQWNRDGSRLVWVNAQSGIPSLFTQAADRSGRPELLMETDHSQYPTGFAPDGRLLVADRLRNSGRADLVALSLDTRRVTPLVVTEASEGDATVSPDGHWIAYTSDESGVFEVYVNPYPDTDGGKWKVSTSGGKHPLWSRNGRELYYRDFAGAIVAVPVPAGPRFLPGQPVTILPNQSYAGDGAALSSRSYDLSLDGTRFLMVKRVDSTGARSMVLEENWTAELKRLLPAR